MEILILLAVLLVALSCLCINFLIAYVLWQHLLNKKPETVQSVQQEETQEEKEARRLAAEAQKNYEQGFVNLMNYDGRPVGRKDGDL